MDLFDQIRQARIESKQERRKKELEELAGNKDNAMWKRWKENGSRTNDPFVKAYYETLAKFQENLVGKLDVLKTQFDQKRSKEAAEQFYRIYQHDLVYEAVPLHAYSAYQREGLPRMASIAKELHLQGINERLAKKMAGTVYTTAMEWFDPRYSMNAMKFRIHMEDDYITCSDLAVATDQPHAFLYALIDASELVGKKEEFTTALMRTPAISKFIWTRQGKMLRGRILGEETPRRL